MTGKEIAQLLYEEMENKKGYSAHPGTRCDVCHSVASGDIIFMGVKQKVCSECVAEIMQWLEGVS